MWAHNAMARTGMRRNENIMVQWSITTQLLQNLWWINIFKSSHDVYEATRPMPKAIRLEEIPQIWNDVDDRSTRHVSQSTLVAIHLLVQKIGWKICMYGCDSEVLTAAGRAATSGPRSGCPSLHMSRCARFMSKNDHSRAWRLDG